MLLEISNKVYINVEETNLISNEIIKNIKEKLTFLNPEYVTKEKMNIPIWGTPKYLKLYEEVNNKLIVPYGFLTFIKELFYPYKITRKDCQFELNDNEEVDYNSKIGLRDYQELVKNTVINAKANSGIIVMPAGSGKGHPLNTKLYTPTGLKEIGKLNIGDQVIGSNGKPTTVTGVYDRGVLDTYRVYFNDDSFLDCDEEHLFQVQTSDQRLTTGNWSIKSVKEMQKLIEKNKSRKIKFFIPLVEPVSFNPRDTPIDPYLLGLLLGDGGMSGDRTLFFSNSEPDIIDYIRKDNELIGKKGSKCDYYFRNCKRLIDSLKHLELFGHKSNEKFVPDLYKYNDSNVRLELLRGLIDTDGSVHKSGVSITTTSKMLCLDIIEIVQLLGGTCNVAERMTSYIYKGELKKGLLSYRISINLKNVCLFNSCKHKKKFSEPQKYKTTYRGITKITQIKSTEIRCISVDANDHLYVTENAIVTHNTQTSLEIIASLKKKTLWITHTQDLLKQSLDRAKANFDLNKEAFGTITSGKINLGTHITFATVQTLAKIDLNEIKDEFDMLVVDETHRVVANVKKMGMFQKIIESIPCRYKYGLTATEHRSDDLFDCVYYLIGNKLIDIDKETIKENLVPVNIKTINTSYSIINNTNVIDSDGTLVYSKMLSDMSLCATRNISILNILNKEKNEFNLVLSNRLEHLNELADKLDKDCKYAVIDGNTKKKLREQAIEDARNGNINFLFATFALAKEGLDIPRLNRLHLTQPVKDYAVVVQSLGRIARTFVNKDFAIAYDYSDANVGMLKKQYRERCKHYLRENYKVI